MACLPRGDRQRGLTVVVVILIVTATAALTPSQQVLLSTYYPHVGLLTPETYLPVDRALAAGGLSPATIAEITAFLESGVGDACLSAAVLDVALEDQYSRTWQGLDFATALSSTTLYRKTSLGSRGYALDRESRIREYTALECLSRAQNRSQEFRDGLVSLLPQYYQERSNASEFCNSSAFVTPTCSSCSPYRTANGSCNNLARPLHGMAGTPLRRFASPAYDDGFGSPRTKSVTGDDLPSARAVSTTVINRASDLSTKFTHMLMQWAQIIDHDLTASPTVQGGNGAGLLCCADDAKLALNLSDADAAELQSSLQSRYGCFNIPVPPGDAQLNGSSCIGLSRSASIPAEDCRIGERTAFNKLTAYIDGSMVYGSSDADMAALRAFVGGLLRTQEIPGRRSMMPTKGGQMCNSQTTGCECFSSGDERVNEQPGLASLHTVLMREHNRVAGRLAAINPQWSDERLFQEARKIVVAEIQHITYSEFLPLVLGADTYDLHDLRPQAGGAYYDGYDADVDPSVRTEFSSIAYRFGHTLIRDTFTLADSNYKKMAAFRLQFQFFKPDFLCNNSVTEGAILRGMLIDQSEKFDGHMTTQVTDHLFQTGGPRNTPLDLAALNIQRARDHGIPSYTRLREVLGMPVPNTFNDLNNTLGPGVIGLLQRAYADVRDIDPFPGGVSELPLPGALLGPMFAKIIAMQFSLAKKGDRYFYENACSSTFGAECGGACNFTPSQLAQIKKASLARLLCDNADIGWIQPSPLLVRGPSNAWTSCQDLPRVYLAQWQEI